jgi:CID domain
MQPPQHSSQCSISRRRLHLLYLLSDLLHHTKYHAPGTSLHRNLTESFEPPLLELVRQAAADKKTRVRRRLEDLVLLWEKEAHFKPDLVKKLGQTIDDPSAVSEQRVPPSVTSTTKEMPFIMPPAHGDPSLPFYELPAGNPKQARTNAARFYQTLAICGRSRRPEPCKCHPGFLKRR